MLRLLHISVALCLACLWAAATPSLSALPDSVVQARADSIWEHMPDDLAVPASALSVPDAAIDAVEFSTADDRFSVLGSDTIPVAVPFDKYSGYNEWEEREVEYNPDPNRAVWMSALLPGLGQVYNRRYWKLPIVVGGYLGLAYATSWNNTMLTDYTRAYRDIRDTDPSTNSYMNFFPPTVQESDLDHEWLENILRSRRDYFRRNRDLCIICMVGVYFLAMVDAYVDASLAHFDISPDISMDVTPTLIQDGRNKLPSVGLHWAFTF